MATRQHILAALQAAVQSVEPGQAIRRYVKRSGNFLAIGDARPAWDMSDLRLIAVGKAALPMAAAIAQLAGDKIDRAVVITPHHSPPVALPATWQIISAAHPVPDFGSLAAGNAARQLLANGTAQTLILACISGGATSLLLDPPPEISLTTLQAIYRLLLASGADIQEMNAVRSRLDQMKGGGLVAQAQPAQVIGLILSDVVGDSLATIGSGLTNHPQAQNILVGNNAQACQAAADYLQNLGYLSRIVTTELRGEAQAVGRAIAQEIVTAPTGTALIYGGETTVTLPSDCLGQGGRNQELALAAAIELHQHQKSAWIASMGTDGIDGQSAAAGAIVNELTVQQGQAQGLSAPNYLQSHDSYHFLRSLAAPIETGATGTNVADIVIAIHP